MFTAIQLKQDGLHNGLRRLQVQQADRGEDKTLPEGLPEGDPARVADHVLQPGAQLHHLWLQPRFRR